MRLNQPKKIKTVIFDLSEVLIDFWTGLINSLTTVVPQAPAVVRQQLDHPVWDQLIRGQIFEDDYWRQVILTNGWNLPLEVPKQLARHSFREIDGVRSQINDLRRRGYQLGLLSNHAREWVDEINQRFDHESLFDHVFYSCDLGLIKPEREIYIRALSRMGAIPDQTLFIDDMPRNVKAANELRINGMIFITAHQLRQDLARILG